MIKYTLQLLLMKNLNKAKENVKNELIITLGSNDKLYLYIITLLTKRNHTAILNLTHSMHT